MSETNAKNVGVIINNPDANVTINNNFQNNQESENKEIELSKPTTPNPDVSDSSKRKLKFLFLLLGILLLVFVGKFVLDSFYQDKDEIIRKYTKNEKAVLFYKEGKNYWEMRDRESMEMAAHFFQKAIVEDKNFTLAYSSKALAYVLFANYDTGSDLPWAEALNLANKALEMKDPIGLAHAEAHTALGAYKRSFKVDIDGAEDEYNNAIKIYENFATAHQWLGIDIYLHKAKRDYRKAIGHTKKAAELEPQLPVLTLDFGGALATAGCHDEALKVWSYLAKKEPSFPKAYHGIGEILRLNKQYPEAIRNYKKAIELDNRPYFTAFYILALAEDGQNEIAESLGNKFIYDSNIKGVDYNLSTIVYAALGNKERALDSLEEYCKKFPGEFNPCNPFWKELKIQDHPRFQKLTEQYAPNEKCNNSLNIAKDECENFVKNFEPMYQLESISNVPS
jgi:tetratricopeptide (TPR) repeat protein